MNNTLISLIQLFYLVCIYHSTTLYSINKYKYHCQYPIKTKCNFNLKMRFLRNEVHKPAKIFFLSLVLKLGSSSAGMLNYSWKTNLLSPFFFQENTTKSLPHSHPHLQHAFPSLLAFPCPPSPLLSLFHRDQDMVPDLHLLSHLLSKQDEAGQFKILQGWLNEGSQVLQDLLWVGSPKSFSVPSIHNFFLERENEEGACIW